MYTKAIKGNSQFKKKSIYRKLTLAHVPNIGLTSKRVKFTMMKTMALVRIVHGHTHVNN